MTKKEATKILSTLQTTRIVIHSIVKSFEIKPKSPAFIKYANENLIPEINDACNTLKLEFNL